MVALTMPASWQSFDIDCATSEESNRRVAQESIPPSPGWRVTAAVVDRHCPNRFIMRRSPSLLKTFGDDQFAGHLPSWRRSLYAMRHPKLGLPEAETLNHAESGNIMERGDEARWDD